MEFRLLKANEIECRVQKITEKGCILLIYKDARVDQRILDETVGPLNWQRDHKELKGNIYAGIGIWDEKKQIWIWKWDAGAESFSDKEKGEASDSFKRAGFNWGIGRELYTSPFIWINLSTDEVYKTKDKQGKDKFNLSSKVKFHVTAIKCNENREIIGLQIKDQDNKQRFLLRPKGEKE